MKRYFIFSSLFLIAIVIIAVVAATTVAWNHKIPDWYSIFTLIVFLNFSMAAFVQLEEIIKK